MIKLRQPALIGSDFKQGASWVDLDPIRFDQDDFLSQHGLRVERGAAEGDFDKVDVSGGHLQQILGGSDSQPFVYDHGDAAGPRFQRPVLFRHLHRPVPG